LHDAFDGQPPIDSLPLFNDIAPESIRVVSQMIKRELNSPQARGVGRYFDGFGSLALGRPASTYEGQVAIAWDHVASDTVRDAYPFALDRSRSPMEVDLRSAVRAAFEDVVAGVAAADVSGRFHNMLVSVTVEVVEALRAEVGSVPVALTGGVFQNARLAAGIGEKLSSKIKLLRHSEVPPGDGGIALGQALIASAFLGDKG
jgi:hydrogenase maturation protein HypF